jgi:hypothetical protein
LGFECHFDRIQRAKIRQSLREANKGNFMKHLKNNSLKSKNCSKECKHIFRCRVFYTVERNNPKVSMWRKSAKVQPELQIAGRNGQAIGRTAVEETLMKVSHIAQANGLNDFTVDKKYGVTYPGCKAADEVATCVDQENDEGNVAFVLRGVHSGDNKSGFAVSLSELPRNARLLDNQPA